MGISGLFFVAPPKMTEKWSPNKTYDVTIEHHVKDRELM